MNTNQISSEIVYLVTRRSVVPNVILAQFCAVSILVSMGPKTKPEPALEGELFACPQCSKGFNNKQNLIRHERRNHRLKNFQCYHCPYNTKFKFQLRKHITNIHINTDRRKTYCRRNKIPFKCCLCEDYECNARADMLKHYGEEHKVPMEEQIVNFDNIVEFMEWKEHTEFQECFKFTLASKHSDRKTNTSYYRCFRDGHYVPKGKGKRKLKLKGTNKTNSVCPCSVRLIRPSHKESCQAIYISQHVGHSTEVSRLTLTKQEKSTIAEKLSAQIPFNSILDSIRESLTTSDYKRIHLTTFKDLHNIRKSFGLDEGPRRSKGSGGGSDSEPRTKARKGNKSSTKPVDSGLQVNESEMPVEDVKEPWQTQASNNDANNRIDTIIGSWHEVHVISKEPYIAIKSPGHLMCSSLQTDLNTSNVESSWQERQLITKHPSNMNPSDVQVSESWHEVQPTSKDHTDAGGTTNFNNTSHHANDVVSLAWQGAQVIDKDPCNIKNTMDLNTSSLQSNVEGSWQEAQGITKHSSNIKSSLDPSQTEIAVGWPGIQSHPRAVSHKDPSNMSSLQLNGTQRADVAVEDSWHDLEPSHDGSDIHHSNDEGGSYSSNDLATQKQEVGDIFSALLESVKNGEELDLIKKALAPLSDTFQSMRRVAVENQDKSTLVPWWSKPY